MRPDAIRILDVNLRPPYVDRDIIRDSIALADVVKFNHDERVLLGEMFETDSVEEYLLSEKGIHLAILTRGSEGCSLFTPDEQVDQPGIEVDTSDGDAVGVGDSFVAAVIHEMLRDAPVKRIAAFANRYAAIVAQKKGGMPEMGNRDS